MNGVVVDSSAAIAIVATGYPVLCVGNDFRQTDADVAELPAT